MVRCWTGRYTLLARKILDPAGKICYPTIHELYK